MDQGSGSEGHGEDLSLNMFISSYSNKAFVTRIYRRTGSGTATSMAGLGSNPDPDAPATGLGRSRRSINQGRVISHSLLHSPEILVAYQKYRFDTDQQITQGPIPKQSIVRRLLNLHQDTSVSRSLVEAKHNLFGGKKGRVLLIRWQDSEMTIQNSLISYFSYYGNSMEREDGEEATPLSHDLRPWIV